MPHDMVQRIIDEFPIRLRALTSKNGWYFEYDFRRFKRQLFKENQIGREHLICYLCGQIHDCDSAVCDENCPNMHGPQRPDDYDYFEMEDEREFANLFAMEVEYDELEDEDLTEGVDEEELSRDRDFVNGIFNHQDE